MSTLLESLCVHGQILSQSFESCALTQGINFVLLSASLTPPHGAMGTSGGGGVWVSISRDPSDSWVLSIEHRCSVQGSVASWKSSWT